MRLDICEMLDLCEKYRDMGWAVQDQLAAVIDGEPLGEQNGAALEVIRKFLVYCDKAGVSGAFEVAEEIKSHLLEQAAS